MTEPREPEWPKLDVPDNHTEVLAGWLHIHQAVEAVQAEMTARIEKEGGCTLLEHQALYHLAVSPGQRLSMLRLAEALPTSPSGATRLVERLVKRGWVGRQQPPDNRRQTDAVLTDDGYTALNTQTRPAYHRAVEECFGELLTPTDLDNLRRAGRKLLQGHHRFDAQRFAEVEYDKGNENT